MNSSSLHPPTSVRERDEMKTSSRGRRTSTWILAVGIVFTSLLPAPLLAEPIPLKRVVELALAHATGAAIATADEQHAAASYSELHTSYVPQLTAGAGLGPPAYGFPLSLEGQPPSLFNINMQSALINPSLRDFLKAARIESAAAALKSKDQRNQIIQDAVLSYAELSKWDERLSHLQETQIEADKMQTAIAERVKEGVDTELDGTRARLSKTNPLPSMRQKPIPAFKPRWIMPEPSICAPRGSTMPSGRASISRDNTLCFRVLTIFRTITSPKKSAPHQTEIFSAPTVDIARTTPPSAFPSAFRFSISRSALVPERLTPTPSKPASRPKPRAIRFRRRHCACSAPSRRCRPRTT